MEPENLEIVNNEPAHQFEADVDGHTAVLTYRHIGGSLALEHTEVPPELGGRGIASMLARAALDHARAVHLEVVPNCPYVSAYLKKHSEYHDLLSEENLEKVLRHD
jgi:uncharacterized protein